MRRLIPILLIAGLTSFGPSVSSWAQAENRDEAETIELDLREPIELQTLMDYAAREYGYHLLYEPGVLSGSVRLQTQGPIPRDALPGMLNAALRLHGYAMVDLDVPGFKRVARVDDVKPALPDVAEPAASNDLVVQAVKLSAMETNAAVELVTPVLTSPANVVFVSDQQQTLLLADERERIERALSLIAMVENAEAPVAVRTVILRHALARDVANTVREVLVSKLQGAGKFRQVEGLRVLADVRTNQVVISAHAGALDEALKLVASLDTEVMSQVTPVRRYKLTNTTARDLLATLRAVSGEGSDDPFGFGDGDAQEGLGLSFGERDDESFARQFGGPEGRNPRGARGTVNVTVDTNLEADRLSGDGVTLAADINTNSIIVVADPATQEIYANLIELLDERRPQVQIEATLVSLNTTNDYTLGVEFGFQNGLDGDAQLITFGSFGISTVDAATGGLTPTVNSGLTSALLDASFAEVVIQAFEQDANSRVLSAPTLLVNDNERGRLQSLTEEPTVTITQGEVSDQISFREYVEAGTTIDVIPNISEGGYLQLEYRVEVNTFLPSDPALAAAGVPPPRQTDSLQSRVTIPNGHTIVVGGLTSQDDSETVSKIPLLGDLPIIGVLFRQTTTNDERGTLFVFLRPTILADDDFADLRGLSDGKLREAGLPSNEPYDEPDLILD
ncbi:MAG: secretin N-terminal domain-containing protein [Planctomycetota bacterium]